MVVFAGDGGGTLYALYSPTGSPVYRLPPGSVIAGIYESGNLEFDVVAPDLASFLARLRHAVESFAETSAITTSNTISPRGHAHGTIRTTRRPRCADRLNPPHVSIRWDLT